MDITDILARVMGVFSLIVGIAMFYRKKTILALLHDFFTHRTVAFAVGAIELLLAIFFVTIHWEWRSPLEIIVSLFGVILFLEGLFYILISNEAFQKLHRSLRLEKFYYVGMIYSLVIGIFLTIASLL